MKWKKLGLIFSADHHHEWMISHASNPVAEYLGGSVFRVYFSCRDQQNRSSIGFVEFDINQPDKILRISEKPVVQPGDLGTFDDSGTSMGCLACISGKRYLYYLGWNLGVTVPWRNSIGLAVSNTSACDFTKYSKAPIMDRSAVDPYSISYPSIIKDGDVWKMWYGSNLNWGTQQADMAHVIKYAESLDGVIWHREGIIAINFKSPGEYAISKPCVIQEEGLYKMWYSYRGDTYRIGYAESKDGIHWSRRDDQVGIGLSESGWDSESIEYAFVFGHKGQKFMLYNGNCYGKTGFGLAVMLPN